jgi:putative sterol carrier protein
MTLTAEFVMAEACAGLRRIFQPEHAATVDAVVQFVLTGEGGAEFYATIRRGAMTLEAGRAPSSKVSMRMAAGEFLDMLSGKLSTADAFASGKLKVGGNLIYAVKLATVFKFGAS